MTSWILNFESDYPELRKTFAAAANGVISRAVRTRGHHPIKFNDPDITSKIEGKKCTVMFNGWDDIKDIETLRAKFAPTIFKVTGEPSKPEQYPGMNYQVDVTCNLDAAA